MNYTENYNLNKPEKSEQYNVEHWTDNMDTIDTALKANADAIARGVSNLTQGLSAETNARMNGVSDAKDLANAVGILAPAHGGTGQNSLISSINALLAVSSEAETLSNTDRVIFERIVGNQVSTINSTLTRLADKIYALIAERISEASIPVGVIYPFCVDFGANYENVPLGFLACDGHEVSRTQFAKLFSKIGTRYGNGDEINTFNVPDLRECALVGAGENTHDSIATHDTYTLGQFKDDQLQNHTHGMSHNHTYQHRHDKGDMEISGDFGGLYRGENWANGSFVLKDASYGQISPNGENENIAIINFSASRNWTGKTGWNDLNETSYSQPSTTVNQDTSRNGVVTRMKSKGVNFIIKY